MSDSHSESIGIWPLMASVKGSIALAMVCSVLSWLLNLAALVLFACLISQFEWLQAEPGWLWLCLGLAAAGTVLRLGSFQISHLASYRLEVDLRKQLAAKLAVLPLGFVSEQGSGRLAKVMQQDVKDLHAFVADSTPMLARLYLAPVAVLLVCLWFSWPLTLAMVGALLVGAGVLSVAMRGHETLSQEYVAMSAQFNQQAVEYIQAMPVVRTFDSGSASFSRLQKTSTQFRTLLSQWMQASGKSARLSMWLFTPLPLMLWVLASGYFMLQQEWVSFTAVVVVALVSGGLVEALLPLMWLHHAMRKSRDAADRIASILNQPALLQTVEQKRTFSPVPSVQIENLTFSYPGQSEPALQDLTLALTPGTVTALVGASGSGKSTLARLLPRFWDPDQGRIRIDAHDIRDLTPEQLMSQLAFVFQDSYLFDDSLLENIRLGVPEASLEDVRAAAQVAQIDDFIQTLPEGYETRAGAAGLRLSGGQKQRLAIARALVQNKPILVLDEATAYADPDNEHLLMQALARLMVGRTVLIIAHRLNTIQTADQIVVLERGRIAEQGTHGALLDRQGRYAQLWQAHLDSQQWLLDGQLAAHKETDHV